MIRFSTLALFSALSLAACALETGGDGDTAATGPAGNIARVADASDPVPSFVDHDANAGGGSAVLVGAGADAPDAAAAPADAGTMPDTSPPLGGPKPPPPDDKKEGGK